MTGGHQRVQSPYVTVWIVREGIIVGDTCKLKAANNISAHCENDRCTYWRVVDHLDIEASADGCAIQYFELLGDEGSEVSAWLLSVRERLAAAEVAGEA